MNTLPNVHYSDELSLSEEPHKIQDYFHYGTTGRDFSSSANVVLSIRLVAANTLSLDAMHT